MNQLSPALLELVARAMNDDESRQELIKHVETLKTSDSEPAADQTHRIDGATVDLGRAARCGFGEVIFGEGKSAELVTRIIQTQLDQGQSAFITRIDSGVAFQVRQSFTHTQHNPVARTLRVSNTELGPAQPLASDRLGEVFHAAVITAGSTDIAVAEEAIETLAWMGIGFQRFDDIGVAGPQRLAAAIPELKIGIGGCCCGWHGRRIACCCGRTFGCSSVCRTNQCGLWRKPWWFDTIDGYVEHLHCECCCGQH